MVQTDDVVLKTVDEQVLGVEEGQSKIFPELCDSIYDGDVTPQWV